MIGSQLGSNHNSITIQLSNKRKKMQQFICHVINPRKLKGKYLKLVFSFFREIIIFPIIPKPFPIFHLHTPLAQFQNQLIKISIYFSSENNFNYRTSWAQNIFEPSILKTQDIFNKRSSQFIIKQIFLFFLSLSFSLYESVSLYYKNKPRLIYVLKY